MTNTEKQVLKDACKLMDPKAKTELILSLEHRSENGSAPDRKAATELYYAVIHGDYRDYQPGDGDKEVK